MNRKQLILLAVVAMAIGAVAWLASRREAKTLAESARRIGDKVIPDFAINDVEQILIKQTDGQITLARKDDIWVVQDRGGHPANFETIRDFLRKVWELKIVQPISTGPSRLPLFELTPPDKGTNSGTLVEFRDKNNKTINSLLLGKKHMRESKSDSPYGGGGWPDGRYLMVGNDARNVVLVSEAFASIEAKPDQWLNKDWFKVEKHKSIAVTTTNATNNWKLFRESETNDWKLVDAKADEQLDTGKSSGVTSALSSPTFNDVATNNAPEQTGLNKPLLAKLETVDGFTYDVKVGNKVAPDKEDYYLQVAVAANLPKERAPAKDEKPEDKAKLDKEFQEKVDKLKEKLKTEKAFENWTYVVSKWTIDALLKERKDLLAEKKEELKKEESKPGTSSPNPSAISPPIKLPGTGLLDPPPPGKTPVRTAPPPPPAPKPADNSAPKP